MIGTGPVLEARRAPTLVPQHAKAEERRRIVPATVLMLAAAVAIGVTVRALHALSAAFPLNDGALFYQMVRDLQAAHYRLPAFTTYNDASIPFAYSPLGFYLVAALNDLTGMSLVDLFRWVPLIFTCLTLVACVMLARRLLGSRLAVTVAVITFGLLPRSFLWLLMGGGVTRAPGFLFAILALYWLTLLWTTHDRRHLVPATICSALTVLSHLGTAPFLAFSALLFMLAFARNRFGLTTSSIVAGGALALSAPWWGAVIAMHGVGPFIAANQTGGSIFHGLTWEHLAQTLGWAGLGTGEPLLAVGGMLAVLGTMACVATGSWLLPIWWIVIVALDARAGSTYATLPIALLAGIGVSDVVIPLLRRSRVLHGRHVAHARHGHAHADVLPFPAPAGRWKPQLLVLGILFAFAFLSSLITTPGVPGGLPDLTPLSREERWAMRWVARTTPVSSQVLVIAQRPWEIDKVSEWMPVLGERVSVATVQGTEWLPSHAFARRQWAFNELQGCGNWVADCLDDWSTHTGIDFTHVFFPKNPAGQCCQMLIYAMRNDPAYQLVYDGPGAIIFQKRPQYAAR